MIKDALSGVPTRLTVLPHPEESPNYANTIHNVDLQGVVNKWLVDWNVPSNYWEFWHSVTVLIKADSPYIAATWSDQKLMWVQPPWCNPGVIAHEMSHISYWHLSAVNHHLFNTTWRQYQSDPYMHLLVTQRPNTGVSDIEAHAEIYRFLGIHMPAGLKQYYPYLF